MRFKTCINYLLTVSQHEVFQLVSERLSQFGVTPGQYGVLNYLWDTDSATPKEIAQELVLENSTISGVLDRMQKKGLIDRRLDPNDKRSIQVVLTPEGAGLKQEVLRAVEEVNQQVLNQFGEEQRDILLHCLQQIADMPFRKQDKND